MNTDFLLELADRLLDKYEVPYELKPDIREDARKLRQLAAELAAELKAAGPPTTVQVCSLSTDPEAEVELAMTVRFHGDMDWFVLSFYGRSAEDTKLRAPLRDLSMEEIRGYVLNARQWAERHGFAFELGELVEAIVTPLEVAS